MALAGDGGGRDCRRCRCRALDGGPCAWRAGHAQRGAARRRRRRRWEPIGSKSCKLACRVADALVLTLPNVLAVRISACWALAIVCERTRALH